jgi:hypothetical protein
MFVLNAAKYFTFVFQLQHFSQLISISVATVLLLMVGESLLLSVAMQNVFPLHLHIAAPIEEVPCGAIALHQA